MYCDFFYVHKKIHVIHAIAIFTLLPWSRTKPTVSPRYVSIGFLKNTYNRPQPRPSESESLAVKPEESFSISFLTDVYTVIVMHWSKAGANKSGP